MRLFGHGFLVSLMDCSTRASLWPRFLVLIEDCSTRSSFWPWIFDIYCGLIKLSVSSAIGCWSFYWIAPSGRLFGHGLVVLLMDFVIHTTILPCVIGPFSGLLHPGVCLAIGYLSY